MLTDFPKHLSVHMNFIQHLESTVTIKAAYPFSFENFICSQSTVEAECRTVDLEKYAIVLKRTIDITDIVINETDKQSILAFYGIKLDSRPDANKLKT